MHTDLLAPPAEGRRRQCPLRCSDGPFAPVVPQVPGPDHVAAEDHASQPPHCAPLGQTAGPDRRPDLRHRHSHRQEGS